MIWKGLISIVLPLLFQMMLLPSRFSSAEEDLYQEMSGKNIGFMSGGESQKEWEILEVSTGGYLAREKVSLLEIYLAKVEGVVDSSLSRALRKAGEGNGLALAIEDVLVWQIDFSRDTRRGDRFRVLVEKIYKGGRSVGYGKIHAVEYQTRNKRIMGILFEDRYYDEKGNALARNFLKRPLRYHYISSGFDRKRKHPIMGGVEPHLGIDYAAPTGTPVWAVANGVVVFSGWVEGYGKQIIIRHPNGYTSYYGHLSRYAAGIKEGKRVEQKQVIGYVGSTGLSTGPHLDYRLSKDGQFINPRREIFQIEKPIQEKDRKSFDQRKNEVLAWLRRVPL